MEQRIASREQVMLEFQQRLKDIHGIKLNRRVCRKLMIEMSLSIKTMLLSQSYDKVELPEFGYLLMHKKPARKLHVNLPQLESGPVHLPERYELRFKPSMEVEQQIKDL